MYVHVGSAPEGCPGFWGNSSSLTVLQPLPFPAWRKERKDLVQAKELKSQRAYIFFHPTLVPTDLVLILYLAATICPAKILFRWKKKK